MFNILLKKQMIEMNHSFFQNKKDGGARAGRGAFITMYALAIIAICIIFAVMLAGAWMLSPLIECGMSWLYLLTAGAAALVLGTAGSVSGAASCLYNAKDNDLLLSMPVPVWKILAARLTGVYLTGLMYSLAVFVPALLVYYYMHAARSAAGIICPVIFTLETSIFSFVLSCALGWVLARLGRGRRIRALSAVAAAVIFAAAYMIVYYKAAAVLQDVTKNADSYQELIMSRAWVLYAAGRGAAGDAGAAIALASSAAVLLAVTVYIMVRTFAGMTGAAAAPAGGSRATYRENKIKVRSELSALFVKEVLRFTASPSYMLNCAFGSVFLLLAAAAGLIKGEKIMDTLYQLPGGGSSAAVMLALGICMLVSANNITSAAISLEGRNLWILQAMPVASGRCLMAKLLLHIVFTAVPAFICSCCACIMLKPGALMCVMIVMLPLIYTCLSAAFGLMMNLKDPHMSWLSETAAVKQNIHAAAASIGGWIFTALLAGIYILLQMIDFLNISSVLYMIICAMIFIAGTAFLMRWIMLRGIELFESL